MDLLLILLIIGLPLIAQIGIKSSYNKYKQIENKKRISGFEVAKKILEKNGLEDIYIVETQGQLTDHYDPTRRVIRLSSDIFHGTSIAAAAVAAHECGHAIQDKEKYTFFEMRSALVPVVNAATSISYWIIFIGFLMEAMDLVWIGIALTCIGLLFQVITLPVELDASSRANTLLLEYNLVNEQEQEGTKSVLKAAAFTYVAGVLASAVQILRLILIAQGNRRRR